jgi:hypothetical protein
MTLYEIIVVISGQIENCTLSNSVVPWCGITYDPRGVSSVPIVITDSTVSNISGLQGSALYIWNLQKGPNYLTVSNCHFHSNVAYQGGAVFIYGINFFPNDPLSALFNLSNCTFSENYAMVDGPTFASTGAFLSWAEAPPRMSLFSGDLLLPFSILYHDYFMNQVASSNDQFFLAFNLTMYCNSSVSHIQDGRENGTALLEHTPQSPCGELQPATDQVLIAKILEYRYVFAIGDPGQYTIVVSQTVSYNAKKQSLRFPLTIRKCESPRVVVKRGNEKYPRCLLRKLLFTILLRSISFILILYVLDYLSDLFS